MPPHAPPTAAPPRARPATGGARPGGGANYTDGDVGAHILRLTSFMTMGFLAMTIAQFVEAVYLGKVGTDELAAVAFTFPLTLGLNAMVRGLGIGASAVVARNMGSGDRDRAGRLISHCLLLVVGFSAVFLLAALLWSHHLFAAMGASGHVQLLATQYTHVWFIGFPLFALSMVGTGLIRSVGDAAYPGYVMTLGSVLQIIIGPFLIFGWLGLPALGIQGAAWAFVIARTISFAMTWWWFARKERMLVFDLEDFRASATAILHVGAPSVLTNLVPSVSSGIITSLLATFGHGVVAGFGVASRVDSLVSMIVIAIASSTGPMVGQNWGARKFERVHESLRLCYRLCLAWGLLSGLVMIVGGRFLVSIINADPVMVATAVAYLSVVPFSAGFMGVMQVASSSFNALSKPVPPLVLSMVRMLVLYVPLAWLGAYLWGYPGIFYATAAANVIMGIAAWYWNKVMIAAAIARATQSTPIRHGERHGERLGERLGERHGESPDEGTGARPVVPQAGAAG